MSNLLIWLFHTKYSLQTLRVFYNPILIRTIEGYWPNQDDQMNMTEIGEHDQKLTTKNLNMVNIVLIWWTTYRHWDFTKRVHKLTKNIINIATTMNVNGWVWPKIENILPQTGFDLGFLRPQAGVLTIEPKIT